MLPAYKVAGGLSRGSAVFPAPGGRRIHGRGFGECVRRGRVRPARKAGGGRKDGGSRREERERGRERFASGREGRRKKKGGDSFWVSGGKALDMRRTPFGAYKGGGTLSRRTEVSCEAPDQNTVITHVDFESKKPRVCACAVASDACLSLRPRSKHRGGALRSHGRCPRPRRALSLARIPGGRRRAPLSAQPRRYGVPRCRESVRRGFPVSAPPPLSEKQITAESPPAPWGCSATLPLMEFPSLRAPHSPDALPTLRRPVRTADPPCSGLVRTLSAIPAASPSPACEATGGERLLRPRRAVPPRPRNRPSQAPYHILHGLVNR